MPMQSGARRIDKQFIVIHEGLPEPPLPLFIAITIVMSIAPSLLVTLFNKVYRILRRMNGLEEFGQLNLPKDHPTNEREVGSRQ